MVSELNTLKIFISYSHVDMKYKERLLTTLKPLEQIYNIDVWHDGKILAGGNINEKVLAELECSNIVLLLVTPNFLASWYCMEVELKKSINRMKKGGCIVIPVMFQECVLDSSFPFYNLKRVPKDGKPICKFKPQLGGCTEATNMIKVMIDETFPNSKKKGKKAKTTKKLVEDQDKLFIELYKDGKLQHIDISQNFMSILPECTKNIIYFSAMLDQTVDNAVKRFRKEYNGSTKKTVESLECQELKLFLMDICGYIKKYVTDSVGIRVHFRGTTNNQYIGIIASTDNDDADDLATDWSTDLTPIPICAGLIHYSAQFKASLLKTLNSKLNYKGNNDKIWKEYLTHTFVNLSKSKQPVLSMGISVHKDYYPLKKDLFFLLAYMGFGELVEEYIIKYYKSCKRIDKNYDIENIIKNII